ncbi:putative amino acid transporter, transmembrane domain-containing protein [Helianthus annuus]|uniref:Amino acid transporter, transmembrane domain-containing protein n=1 Tax=Helianthus annuus TaxID=4232 RepID=A0A251SI60_HELAN|nr:probable amino acid permease 7 [Helianthus annuus]KAF5803397.1 putative amino acid transporter, transmembrane domain-containing protein [Helianthus annuus]KAJ0567980.1 putative amino acid transporter, transmembrane domain-containing protein [Helianthus annuus]KAJ0574411.1 putative amino acid transporter, transmembrane domain-containing protein [Helianthus annuus]KAJ0738747.1 putative amino acid transporter, transmembrane domain-containing protein [Helianthus annuus]KAJ0741628.1 putative ami
MANNHTDAPLLQCSNSSDEQPLDLTHRTGTIWTAIAHIITGVMGAGVLSLGWSLAQLGWLFGPPAILVFAAVTLVSTTILSDCYLSPHSEHGPDRNASFLQAVSYYLGEKSQWICAVLLNESLYGNDIAYTIATATSMRAILKSNCYHEEGHDAGCTYPDSIYMLLFGLVQIVVSQIPNFHNMAWLSAVAAIMSFAYSTIGLGLGLANVIVNEEIKGSIGGVPAASAVDKLMLVFQGLGDIAFAYPYSIILLEIQDTLKPPSETKTMKKASRSAILITTVFYLCCGSFGYAAFGNNTPGNLLTGFGFYEPYWLVDLANACVILHLVGGYQVFSQPVFALVETWFSERYPESHFVNGFYQLKLPLVTTFQLNPFRLCFRMLYVVSTTGIAMLFPFFNQVLGVLGALNFWPLVVYFPVEMYFVQRKILPWSRKWIALKTFSFGCFLVSAVGFVGSLEGLIMAKLS